MHQPRVLAALALSSLLLVSGCNGGSDASEPKKSFTPTTDRSPSASEPESTYTPPEPAKPPKGGWPEDKPATEISAEAVARIWVKAYSKALGSEDVSRLRRLSMKSCDNCASFIESIESLAAAGGRLRFKNRTPYIPRELTYVNSDSAPLITIHMRVDASGGERVSEPGDSPTSFKAENYEWFFDLKPIQGRWRVKKMGFVE